MELKRPITEVDLPKLRTKGCQTRLHMFQPVHSMRLLKKRGACCHASIEHPELYP